jgi:hypothetical protein
MPMASVLAKVNSKAAHPSAATFSVDNNVLQSARAMVWVVHSGFVVDIDWDVD